MNIVYFSHSYRSVDADIVQYFGLLLDSEYLIPSLDPPSETVNSAKLERHLRSTDGMVAILTTREGGVSPYILYEISMCVRARKPLLVFVEDVLPDDIIPSRILQRRFSRRAFLRQTREHLHSVRSLKMYLGENSPPIYQQSIQRKTCLLIGVDNFPLLMRDKIKTTVNKLGYSPIDISDSNNYHLVERECPELIACAELAICIINFTCVYNHYLWGAVRSSMTPTITFTTYPSFKFDPKVPTEFQPHIVSPNDSEIVNNMVIEQINLFEEDFIDLDKKEEVQTYTNLLMYTNTKTLAGRYTQEIRNYFVGELNMKDKYVAEQVGAQGPNAHVHDNTLNQIHNQNKNLDLESLVKDLEKLRLALKEQATEVSHDIAVGQVSQAMDAAKKGDKSKALSYLCKSGKWVLDVASQIGTTVIVDVIKGGFGQA